MTDPAGPLSISLSVSLSNGRIGTAYIDSDSDSDSDSDQTPLPIVIKRFVGPPRGPEMLGMTPSSSDRPLNPTEVTQSATPTEKRTDISSCHPDRESGANEWRDLWRAALGSALSASICVICVIFGQTWVVVPAGEWKGKPEIPWAIGIDR